jgi:hypothetical protein
VSDRWPGGRLDKARTERDLGGEDRVREAEGATVFMQIDGRTGAAVGKEAGVVEEEEEEGTEKAQEEEDELMALLSGKRRREEREERMRKRVKDEMDRRMDTGIRVNA